jgi:hypothetical protein
MKLLNKSEELTLQKLSSAIKEHGVRLFSKPRVADVLPIYGSGIDDDLFAYCLKAHFDFVVTDSETKPLFAIEYDGPLHKSDQQQILRDAQKNDICQKFDFPLLRIKSAWINKEYRGMDLLTYFVDTWFQAEAFYEAQKNGIIPYDETFDPTLIVYHPSKKLQWPYWLSLDIQIKFRQMHKAGKIIDVLASDWVGLDQNNNYRCISWLLVNDGKYAIAETGIRSQNFCVDESWLLYQLSLFDLLKDIELILKGQKWTTENELERKLKYYESNYDMRSTGSIIRDNKSFEKHSHRSNVV